MTSVADAVVAAVKAAVPGREVWDGIVPTQPAADGHVVVFCDEGAYLRDSVGAEPVSKRVGWQVSSFGPTRPAAGWLSRHVTDYLMANGVDVSGWTHGIVMHDFTRAPSADEDVKEYPTVMAVDQFSMLLAKTA